CCRLQALIQRLEHSLAGIRLAVNRSASDWAELIRTLVERNGGGDTSVYLQVTRGCMPRREHRLPTHPEPGVVAFCQPRAAIDPGVLEHGIKAVTRTDTRRQQCSIKSTAFLANVLLADDAHAAGAAEALLLRDGCVVEGASCNVFMVNDGSITTPALRDDILAGITRGVIIELAQANGMPCSQIPAPGIEQVRAADEIWVNSSTREIYPVTQLDDIAVGDGQPGPIWAKMSALLHSDTDV